MADGNLNFDTKIDQSRFIKGIKSIGKGVTGFAADIKSLVDRAVSSFKQIAAAYQVQIEAEARLGATMRNSTSASKEEIQSVKDLAGSLQELGVVGDEVQLAGAQELATYVKSADSIKTMLPVLDDMIAQQYGFSASTDNAVTITTMLGKVLQGQTSALSRYGYSFDENQERLLKYGTEEQRVATLAAVVEESVSGVNKALADTPTGKVKQLSNDFGDLKETVGKMLTDVLYPVVTVLDTIVKKINAVFSSISDRIREVMGITDSTDINLGQSFEDVEEVTEEAAQNTADMADSSQEAEKANKGSLAAFDDLNVLQQNSDSNSSNMESVNLLSDIPQTVETSIALDTSDFEKSADKFVGTLKNKIEFIKTKTQEAIKFFEPISQAVTDNVSKSVGVVSRGIEGFLSEYSGSIDKYSGRIRTNLSNTAVQTRNGIVNILDEASKSKDRTGEELSKSYTDLLGGISIFSLSFADVFTDMLDISSGGFEQWTIDNSSLIGEFFDGINSDIAGVSTTIGMILEDIVTTLTEWWDNSGADVYEKIIGVLYDVQSIILEVWNSFIQPIISSLIENVQKLWEEHLSPLWENLLSLLSSIGECISVLWDNIIKPVIDWLIEKLAPGLSIVTTTIVDIVTDCIGWIVDLISGIVKILQGVIDFITGVFSGDIEKAFEAIETIAEGLVTAIIGTLKFIINLLVDGLNLVWGAIYTVVKGIVDTVGNIAGAIGDIFGLDWNFSLPSEPPKIPRLATGTVVPANYGEFAAILGDNKREPEVVSPISAIEQAVENVLNRRGITSSSDGDIVVEIDGREVFRATKKQADHYKRMHGRPAFG